MGEIRQVTARTERVRVTPRPKRMAESLTDYLKEMEIRVRYLHSDIQTMERMELIRAACGDIPNIEVVHFSGLLAHSLEQFNASAVIRGLRAVSDFEYEFQMALMNRGLNEKCETLFMMPSPEYSFVSSRLIKEITKCGGDVSSFVPPVVAEAMRKKFGQNR